MATRRTVQGIEVGTYTEITGPLTAFGETVTADLVPRVQFDATYGILATDVVTATANSGTVVNSASVYSVSTSTNTTGTAQLASRRVLRYRPGEGCRLRLTAAFTAGRANSVQFAGGYSTSEALGYYYNGATFGILRRVAGTQQIITLTVTATAAGAENFTIRLSGVNYTVTSGGALAATTDVAQRIADQWPSAVGTTVWTCRSVGSTVIFVQGYCAASGGTNTFTSSGTATGTMAVTQAGAANDDSTGFVAQTSWNVDRMDGSKGQYNPSGLTLSTTGTPSDTLLRVDDLNVYDISFPYLGVGTIQFRIMGPDGVLHLVHQIRYPGTAVIPTMRNPTLRLGWYVANVGNNTNMVLKGICAAGFIEGSVHPPRDPTGFENPSFSAGTTAYAALVFRVGATFAAQVNRREANHIHIMCGTDSANRVMSVRAVLNPTSISGVLNWQYVSSARSSIEYAIPAANAVVTGGDAVGYTTVASGTASMLDLDQGDVRLEAGDVVAIEIKTLAGAATMTVTATTSEN